MSEGTFPFIPYHRPRVPAEEMERRSKAFFTLMDERRSVREFTADPVPQALIEAAIRTASTAPSGAHKQPWTFVAISDPEIKRQIRIAAEEEEKRTYENRMSEEWRHALEPIGTTWRKPFLETVPWIVVVFEKLYDLSPDGTKSKNYYVPQSVGLACGLFIASLHQMGLSTLTHTPSPMGFLREILGRPKNEKPFILFPVGFPTVDCEVPDLRRKDLEEISVWNPQPNGDSE